MTAIDIKEVHAALAILSQPHPDYSVPRRPTNCRVTADDKVKRDEAVATLRGMGLTKFTGIRFGYNAYMHYSIYRSRAKAEAALALTTAQEGKPTDRFMMLFNDRHIWDIDFEEEYPATTRAIAEQILMACMDGHDDNETERIRQVVLQAQKAVCYGTVVRVESPYPIDAHMIFVQKIDATRAALILRSTLGVLHRTPGAMRVAVRHVEADDAGLATHFFTSMWEWEPFYEIVGKWEMAMQEQDQIDQQQIAEEDEYDDADVEMS